MSLKDRSINVRIARLNEYVRIIKRLQKSVDRKKFFNEDILRAGIERYLQLSLEGVLDISDHIIAEQGFKKPEEYRDNILILGEEGVLPKLFAEKFASAAGFRNVLVHDYITIDQEKVYEHFKKDFKDIEKFLQHIVRFLEK